MPKISRDKTTKGIFVVSCKIMMFRLVFLLLYVKGTVRTKVKEYVERISTRLEYVSL